MLEFPKIFSTGSRATLLPETPVNRFQPLTFTKHFEGQALWNEIEQKIPSFLNTALKVLLTIPLYLIQKTALAAQGLGNAGIFLGNYLFSKHTIVALTPPPIDELPSNGKPILDDPKKDVSKIETVKPSELDHLERVKIAFANIQNSSERLKYAASMGYLEGVKIALDNPETNINHQSVGGRTDFGSTALMNAALEGYKEIVELLLKAGADPNIVDPSKMNDCELSIVDAIFKNGDTALMDAVLGRNRINNSGDKEIVELLLNFKADPNIQDLHGNTALILAAEYNKTEIVELLLNKGANPDIKKFTENMVTFRSQNDWTALMVAAERGRNEIVELLLKAGANPNIQSKYGSTALTLTTHPDTIKLLLKAGANPNILDKGGVGVLIHAAYNGYTDIVKKLIDLNVDVNIRNKYGVTPLLWAAQRGYKEIVELLLKARANLNIQNEKGHTALMLAADAGHKDIVKLLVDAHANLNAQSKKGGLTALMMAAAQRHKEIVKLLLDSGADSDIKDNDGFTVLARSKHSYRADDIAELIKNSGRKSDAN